jgi:CRISPR-associated Csx2 family protein
MQRRYITFVGKTKYKQATYQDGDQVITTPYAQEAEIARYGEKYFDGLLFLMTESSARANWEAAEGEPPRLRERLLARGVPKKCLHPRYIGENIADRAAHWDWLQAVLDFVADGDELVIDMTHGYRVVHIVLSAAIGYLQALKRVRLAAILYSTEPEKDGSPAELVDITHFYAVQSWADAISRLVDNADAGKLAAQARLTDVGAFAGLNDPELLAALEELTALLRNINVNDVAQAAGRALRVVTARQQASGSGAERQMLQMVGDKFAALAAGDPPSGVYDQRYLQVQLDLAGLLLDHGLLMQAYTVLRELVGSIGMVGWQQGHAGRGMDHKDSLGARRSRAEVFVQMVAREEAQWKFAGEGELHRDKMLPWYRQLEARQLIGRLRESMTIITGTRNGFDHAWTSTKQAERPTAATVADLAAKGRSAAEWLRQVVGHLGEDGAALATPPVSVG